MPPLQLINYFFLLEYQGALRHDIQLFQRNFGGLGPLFEGLQPLIIMRMGQQYSKWHMFRISAFYIEFKGAKNPHFLDVLDCGFGGLWRFLTKVSVPDHDEFGFTMSQTNYVQKFSFLHWIKRCKEPSCPWSPGLWIWRTLEVPDRGLGSWSWWG